MRINFLKAGNKIGFVSPERRYEALDRCTAAAYVILIADD